MAKNEFNTLLVSLLIFLFTNASSAEVSNDALASFAEELLTKDVSSLSSKVTIDKQGKTNSGSSNDKAELKLLSINSTAFKHPTVKLLRDMYDNYDPDVKNKEDVTTEELNEENQFLDALIKTEAMEHARNFLLNKDLFTGSKDDFKRKLKEIWFTLYSRGHRKKSSSAFEHIFLGEIKQNQVSGLHNWLYFGEEESKNQLNYLGWMKSVDFGKGSLMKVHYTWKGINKPVGSIFIGTSPEFEVGLYTVCFFARPNAKCDFTLNRKPLFIQTYTFYGPNKIQLIGSAYPDLDL